MWDVQTLLVDSLLIAILLVVPALRLCVRLGLPQALTLVLFVPFIGLPWFLWMVAHRPWPNAGVFGSGARE